MLRTEHVIPRMIDRIKVLFEDVAVSETDLSAAAERSAEDSGFDH